MQMCNRRQKFCLHHIVRRRLPHTAPTILLSHVAVYSLTVCEHPLVEFASCVSADLACMSCACVELLWCESHVRVDEYVE